MKERNQAKNEFEVDKVDSKLSLTDGLLNHLFTSDDTPKKQYLYFVQPNPTCLQQARSPDLQAKNHCGSDNRLHEIELANSNLMQSQFCNSSQSLHQLGQQSTINCPFSTQSSSLKFASKRSAKGNQNN